MEKNTRPCEGTLFAKEGRGLKLQHFVSFVIFVVKKQFCILNSAFCIVISFYTIIHLPSMGLPKL